MAEIRINLEGPDGQDETLEQAFEEMITRLTEVESELQLLGALVITTNDTLEELQRQFAQHVAGPSEPTPEDPAPEDPIEPIPEDPIPGGPQLEFDLGAFAIGENLTEPFYYGANWIFANHWHQSSGWQHWGAFVPSYGGGTIDVRWSGSGTIRVSGEAFTQVTPNHIRLHDVAPDQQMFFQRDGVTDNLQITTSDSVSTSLFNPVFLGRLQPYTVLRYMQWFEINESLGGKLAQPLPVTLMLSRESNTVPWICIPTDWGVDAFRDWLTGFKVSEYQGPVIFEWSNETWNGSFLQYQYAVRRGAASGYAGSENEINARYTVRRSADLAIIASEELGPRAKFVLCSHTPQTWRTQIMLDEVDRLGVDFDAFGFAPYLYGADNAHVDQAISQSMLQRDLVDAAGLPLIGYESGQHFGATNQTPGIEDAYRRFYTDWRGMGGGLICHYQNCGTIRPNGGGWPGAIETQNQPISEAHKYRVLMEMANRL